MSTLICVPIMARDVAPALEDAALAKREGADLVEFRIDELFSGTGDEEGLAACLRLAADSPLPCIMTCRPTWEGGFYDGDEAGRIALFERLGTADRPPAYIDVELAAYTRSANIRQKINLAVEHPRQRRDLHTRLILSMHDFEGRPRDLSRKLAAARGEAAASIIKVAYRCRSLRDNLDLFEILSERDRPTIALGMGEFGVMSRVLAPKFGGFLTFASLRDTSATAPGQPTIRELLDLYRFRTINARTSVFGVMGWPVSHSMSPMVHNAGFERFGVDSVYLFLPVAADPGDPETSCTSFRATLDELAGDERLDLRGVSVTLPFKECLTRAVSPLSEADRLVVEACGAANTAVLGYTSSQGSTPGTTNTDAVAIADVLGQRLALGGSGVAVIGAGGVARAAVFECARAEADVTIFNRNHGRAERLAAELASRLPPGGVGSVRAAPIADLPSGSFDALINCTPVGMRGGPEPDGLSLPVDAFTSLPADAVFFDTVYNPPQTPMLKAARARGFRTIDGVEMFARQAAAQFQLWTGGSQERCNDVTELFDRLVRNVLR